MDCRGTISSGGECSGVDPEGLRLGLFSFNVESWRFKIFNLDGGNCLEGPRFTERDPGTGGR